MSEMYKTIAVKNRLHVVREMNRLPYCISDYYMSCNGERIRVESPNYLGSGMALSGVLKRGQTLDEWVKEKDKRLKSYIY